MATHLQILRHFPQAVLRLLFFRLASVAVCLSFQLQSIAQSSQPQTEAAKRNVLILLADDLGFGDVGFHGGKAPTPNIDRLATEGVELKRFYAYPACSPARAALLTGRFPQRYGIVGPTRARDEGLPVSERLLVADFQAAGFQTNLVGKWHLGQSPNPQSHPTRRGFDHFYGFMDAAVDYFEHTSRERLDWQRDGKPVREQGYATDLLASEAIRTITGRDKSKPFCMVVSFNAPHTPIQAPADLVAKFSAQLGERAGTYAAMLSSLDSGIGRILETIDNEKIRDNTIVVFASDNGGAPMGNNAPFRGKKRQVYEGGVHVPCVVRLPGVLPANTKSDQLAIMDDLFPTLASAAGVKLAINSKHPLDGYDLWANLTTGKVESRSIVTAETDHALIRDQWKLVQMANGATELYDVVADIKESKDLSRDQPKVLAQLTSELVQIKQQVASDLPRKAERSVAAAAQVPSGELSPQFVSTSLLGSKEGEALSAAQLTGDATFGVLGDPRVESIGLGIRLHSGVDKNDDKQMAAEATMTNTSVKPDQRWYRFYISAMAQDGFEVDKDDLYLKVEFFQKNGSSLDLIKNRIYSEVLRVRKDYKDEGTNKNLGTATWENYAMDFRTPFAEVDSLKLSVGFTGGKGSEAKSEFWIRSMSLEPINTPANYEKPISGSRDIPQPATNSLVSLGGRWYYDPRGKDRTVPNQFDLTNSDQLLYLSDRLEAPFAGNMTSWLRPGYLDIDGNQVEKDVYKPDSLVITVTEQHIVMKCRNLPNHPTSTYPDKWRMLDGDPAHIKEQSMTWHIAKQPKVNPNHFAMTANNENNALQGGPIGVATNGVVFFNPFDHILESDAVWRLDRCCGHPSPQNVYHYHKYPVCVKTPWSDEGKSHSAVIGFAFDGFPVYGPYEAKGLLAKDDETNPLNDFNLHEDPQRGPHYHVTPGKFPHIIGGYWGELDPANRRGRQGGGR